MSRKKGTCFDLRIRDRVIECKKQSRLSNVQTPQNYVTSGTVVTREAGFTERWNMRRRSAEDELAMREILKEGDVFSAEIQSVYSDGSLSLHTRSVKYGKLGPGTFMKVSSSLIKRRKNHIHNLPCGVSMILGNNGYIWISPLPNGRMPGTNLEEEDLEGKKPTLEEIRINKSDRKAVARIRNCISTISKAWLPIFDTSVMYAYEASMKYECGELLRPDVVNEIGEVVRQQMLEEGSLS